MIFAFKFNKIVKLFKFPDFINTIKAKTYIFIRYTVTSAKVSCYMVLDLAV